MRQKDLCKNLTRIILNRRSHPEFISGSQDLMRLRSRNKFGMTQDVGSYTSHPEFISGPYSAMGETLKQVQGDQSTPPKEVILNRRSHPEFISGSQDLMELRSRNKFGMTQSVGSYTSHPEFISGSYSAMGETLKQVQGNHRWPAPREVTFFS